MPLRYDLAGGLAIRVKSSDYNTSGHPINVGALGPVTGIKRWDGSSWVDVTVFKRWDGSQWVDVGSVKRWDGTQWVTVT